MARPITTTKKSPELIEAILGEIEKSSSISTTTACKKHGISYKQWKVWLAGDDELSARYARAKDVQIELMAEEILNIADDSSQDTITKTNRAGEQYKAENSEWINRSRLMVDTRKWLLSKLLPKKYGDRMAVEHSGTVNLADMMRQHLAGSGDSK